MMTFIVKEDNSISFLEFLIIYSLNDQIECLHGIKSDESILFSSNKSISRSVTVLIGQRDENPPSGCSQHVKVPHHHYVEY